MQENLPLIIDVKRGSTEDGPGIRTTVFFKGCPLSCVWCHNPETVDPHVEIGFYAKRCIGCGECAAVCPEGAVALESPGRIDRDRCTRCGECAGVCPARALRKIGERWELDALVGLILRDRVFYEVSGGGVTLCGGEPALWPVYAGSLLQRLKSEGISSALQTCGYFDYAAVEKHVLPWLDLVLFDLKIMDGGDHLRFTGKGNGLILDNFSRLLKCGVRVVPRIPLIPGFTTSHDNLTGIARLLSRCGLSEYELLPYNPTGLSKWRVLGKEPPAISDRLLDEAQLQTCRDWCRDTVTTG